MLAVAVHGRQVQRKELQGTVGLQKHHRNRKMALRRARAVAPVDWCCLCCFSGFLCGAHAGIVRTRFFEVERDLSRTAVANWRFTFVYGEI